MSRPRKILVVEDQDEVRNILIRLLSAEGYQVFQAADGIQAVGVLEHQAVDLVLSDVVMPGMDGYELAAHVSSKSKIPILLISGHGREHLGERAPAPVLCKPFSPEVLFAEIERAMGRANIPTE